MRGISIAKNFITRSDELAQQMLFADNRSVMRSVRGRRNGVENLRQIRCAADLFQKLALFQLILHDHRVDRAVLLVKLDQNVINDLMIGLVKRLAIDDLHDIADHLLVEHHRSDEANFRFDRMRRQAIKLAGLIRIDQLAHGTFPGWRRATSYSLSQYSGRGQG